MKYTLDHLDETVEPISIQWKEMTVVKTEEAVACKRKLKNGNNGKAKRSCQESEKVEQLCRVCAEQAAGYHYGVFTCEGCKSFFGRYQKGKRKPPQECMNGHGQCDVKSRARNRCRYCRYQKCLNAGMSKSASRYGRRSNWFKVHCLSEAQEEEDVKNIIPQSIDSEKCDQNLIESSSFIQQHSPPSQISVIVPPIVVNPKPVYPHPTSPGFPVIQVNPMHLPVFPIQQQFFYPTAPATSAFSPVFGHFPTVNVGLSSVFLNPPPVPRPAVPELPVQNEPLDLSLKTSSSPKT